MLFNCPLSEEKAERIIRMLAFLMKAQKVSETYT